MLDHLNTESRNIAVAGKDAFHHVARRHEVWFAFNSFLIILNSFILSDEDIIELKKWVEFYSREIWDNDDVKDIDDLKKLENIDEGMLSKIDRLNEICDYIEDILSHIDDYRKIANKDGNGKIYRLD